MTRPLPSHGVPALWSRDMAADMARVQREEAASRMVAALYVQTGGCYYGLPGVDPWGAERDARLYAGPWPVVAHPPCERWGRMWFGSPVAPDRERFRLGDDGGCFAAALAAVRRWGGVLEHPADSRAWGAFGLNRPPRSGGWVAADWSGGWTCYVEQGHYGHAGRKATWLYACRVELPSLRWGHSGQRLCPIALERYGYAKARRCGMTGRIGEKAKKHARAATPLPFRDLLLSIARSARAPEDAAAQPGETWTPWGATREAENGQG